jgi:hypothetical protein
MILALGRPEIFPSTIKKPKIGEKLTGKFRPSADSIRRTQASTGLLVHIQSSTASKNILH